MYNLASEVVDKGANFYRYRRVQFGLVSAIVYEYVEVVKRR